MLLGAALYFDVIRWAAVLAMYVDAVALPVCEWREVGESDGSECEAPPGEDSSYFQGLLMVGASEYS